MSVLEEICNKKREHVDAQKQNTSLAQLKEKASQQPAPKGFIKAIQSAAAPALITEVKKASPSKGVIRKDFDPVEIAKIYKDNGAACISVLTDEPYFQGKDEYFENIRGAVDLPLLRKDFMIDPYQIHESRALGADCILLIMAALSDEQAKELYNLSTDLGMDVLVEVHDQEELVRALYFDPKMIGVNNRNLKTLEVDTVTSFELLHLIPHKVCKIAESGISNYETLMNLQIAGFNGFLIGESLMRQENIANAVKNLLDTEREPK